MTFTLECLISSLAAVLRAEYPTYPVYDSPTQQGTELPCFFVFFMPSAVEGQIDDRFMRDLGIDIVFVQQRNLVNGNLQIHAIAEYLDQALELFPYMDGSGDTTMIRTCERRWQNEDMELHYQFHIKQRVAVPKHAIRMEEMEEKIDVKET